MDTFSIGQAAREVGVSTRAIRLWEARGLIPPATRTSARYRLFSEADLSLMRFICQAKLLGLTLEEIRDILQVQQTGTGPCERVRQAIDGHLAAIDREITDLARLRDMLIIAQGAAAALGECAGVVCPIIEHTGGANGTATSS